MGFRYRKIGDSETDYQIFTSNRTYLGQVSRHATQLQPVGTTKARWWWNAQSDKGIVSGPVFPRRNQAVLWLAHQFGYVDPELNPPPAKKATKKATKETAKKATPAKKATAKKATGNGGNGNGNGGNGNGETAARRRRPAKAAVKKDVVPRFKSGAAPKKAAKKAPVKRKQTAAKAPVKRRARKTA